MDAVVTARLQALVRELRNSGYSIDARTRPDLNPARAVQLGWNLLRVARQPAPAYLAHDEWHAWDRERQAFRAARVTFFQDHDLVLTPTCFVPTIEHQQEIPIGGRTVLSGGHSRPYKDAASWTILTGMAYLPSTAAPIDLTAAGLPIGVQVIGPFGSDLTTIAMAGEIGRVMGGYQTPPGID